MSNRGALALQGLLTRHREGIAILEIEAGADSQLATFAIRLASTEVRSARESIRVALNGSQLSSPGALAALYTSELAPYVDLLVLPAAADRAAASAHLLSVDPDARLAILAGDAGDESEAVARRLIDSQLETVGTDVAIVAWRSSGLIQPALRRLAPIAPLLAGDITAARRACRGPGAVACRPRRHRFDTRIGCSSTTGRSRHTWSIGEKPRKRRSTSRSPCRLKARPFCTAWLTGPG